MAEFKRVLHIDSHVAFRESFAKVLESSPLVQVVAEAGSAAEGAKFNEHFEIALIGLPLPDDSGAVMARDAVTRVPPAIPVVIVDSIRSDAACLAYEAGARCILPSSIHLDELVWHLSENVPSPKIDSKLSIQMLSRALEIKTFEFQRAQFQSKLSTRELQILSVLSSGLSDREIADRLAISVVTVRTHFVHILEKLGVRTRLQALVLATKYDLHDNNRPG